MRTQCHEGKLVEKAEEMRGSHSLMCSNLKSYWEQQSEGNTPHLSHLAVSEIRGMVTPERTAHVSQKTSFMWDCIRNFNPDLMWGSWCCRQVWRSNSCPKISNRSSGINKELHIKNQVHSGIMQKVQPRSSGNQECIWILIWKTKCSSLFRKLSFHLKK